jgi:beta-glucosidase
MPWASSVSGILQAWYGGNETGNAIADVLYGDVNPSGKLPLSFPVRVEDNPTYLNYRSERGRVLYGEDIYIGYRFYESTRRETKYPFGWGLSYTSFRLSELDIIHGNYAGSKEILTVSVVVENTGGFDGAEVVQVYVSHAKPSIKRPPKELKGFSKAFVKKEASAVVKVPIERKYATSFWDEERDMWIEEGGSYDVFVGSSSMATPLKGSFVVEETSWWSGL